MFGPQRRPDGTQPIDPATSPGQVGATSSFFSTAGSKPAAPASTGSAPPSPTPSNSNNEIAAAEARQRKAQGRLGTIYTSNYGIAPSSKPSLSRQMLTGY